MIPDMNNPIWQTVLSGSNALSNVSLATRMIVARLRVRVTQNPAELRDCVRELREYFVANRQATADLANL